MTSPPTDLDPAVDMVKLLQAEPKNHTKDDIARIVEHFRAERENYLSAERKPTKRSPIKKASSVSVAEILEHGGKLKAGDFKNAGFKL